MFARLITLIGLCLVLSFANCSREVEQLPTPAEGPQFSNNPSSGSHLVTILEDEFQGIPIVLIGDAMIRSSTSANEDIASDPVSEEWRFITAFQRELNDIILQLSPVTENENEVLVQDQLGNHWNLFGVAVEGPWTGAQMQSLNTGTGYWFAFSAMYPGLSIHGESIREQGSTSPPAEAWLIPTNTVVNASGLDGIPAINHPRFLPFSKESTQDIDVYISPSDLMAVVRINGETKAYPYPILDYHEIVNDVVGGTPISLTYCPLTGTTKIWDRSSDSGDLFGVSGLLYNSNLMPFDRRTQSIWHQLEGWCVNGPRKGERMALIHHLEMSWSTFQDLFDNGKVLSTETGFDRIYTRYPYGDYRENHDIILFPLAFRDMRLPSKEKVFAVIANGTAKVYRAAQFL